MKMYNKLLVLLHKNSSSSSSTDPGDLPTNPKEYLSGPQEQNDGGNMTIQMIHK